MNFINFLFKRLLDDADVMLRLDNPNPINTTISKTTSRLFQFVFPNTTNANEMVLLKIKETCETNQCSLVSVQPINSNQVNKNTIPQKTKPTINFFKKIFQAL